MISTSAGIIVADIHGSIHLLGQDFVPKHSWVAHLTGRVSHLAESKGILVTIGVSSEPQPHCVLADSDAAQEEEKPRGTYLKIWDLEHFDKRSGSPVLLRSNKLAMGSKPHPVGIGSFYRS